ncbi:MAG: phage tail tube protein [Methanofastidiosum sp.]
MTEPRRYAGFCEEGSYNPSTAPDAKFHIDIASASLDSPSDPNLYLEGGLSRGRKIVRPGYYAPSGNIVYPIDIRSIGYFLKWTLGNYKFTEETGTNTHEIWASEDTVLPSYTVRLGKDYFEHVFRGCVMNSLELVIEDNFIFATLDMVAAKDTKDDLKEIANLTLFNEHNLSFVDASLTLGSVNYNCKIKGMTITISNEANAESGKGIGSRHPCRIPVGARNIDVKGNLWFENASEYAKFWGAVGGVSASGSSTEVMIVTIDSGTDGSIELNLPKFMYTDLKTSPSGRAEIVQAFSGIALLGDIILKDEITEIESELLITLLNNNGDMDDDIVS